MLICQDVVAKNKSTHTFFGFRFKLSENTHYGMVFKTESRRKTCLINNISSKYGTKYENILRVQIFSNIILSELGFAVRLCKPKYTG